MRSMLLVKGTLFAASALGLVSVAVIQAGDVLPDYQASPEVYKVLAENEQMRVVLATWPVGMKDKPHSHPKTFASYVLKDCHRKLHKSDGTVDEKKIKAGSVRIINPVQMHYFENVGKTECQNLLVELK